MNSGFEIQSAGWCDLFAVNRLEKVCFDRDAWPWIDILTVLTFPGVIRLKAVISGTVIGFAAGDRVKKNSIGRIITLGVHPSYHRQGVGKALLSAAETKLRTPTYQLVVRKSNIAAFQLYSSASYRIVDSWPEYYADGEEGMVMEKSWDPLQSFDR